MKVAPGKAAEAAARGETPPNPTSFFPSVLARQRRAKTEGKKATIIVRPLPRAALRLPGATIMSSLRDFSVARRARIIAPNASGKRPRGNGFPIEAAT